MTEIKTLEDLYNAIVYYPEGNDPEWEELKNAINSETEKNYDEQNIKETAEFFIKYPNWGNDNCIAYNIKKLNKRFNLKKFLKNQTNKCNGIEACPTKANNKGIFIRNGNKRLIVYAMKILNKEVKFQLIKLSDWQDHFERQDLMNLCDRQTIKEPII